MPLEGGLVGQISKTCLVFYEAQIQTGYIYPKKFAIEGTDLAMRLVSIKIQ